MEYIFIYDIILVASNAEHFLTVSQEIHLYKTGHMM